MASVTRRCDGTLARARTLPNGSVRIPATLTRVGIFEYRRDDGTIQRELRHPDEVFAAASIETLAAAPLTIRHPSEMVSPANHRRLSVGHVADNVRQDVDHVAADVVVATDDAIEQVGARKLTEISCGYTCDFDAVPGTWNGERYDGVQRDIQYNHVALLPTGQGRAGRSVGLRLDARGDEIEPETIPALTGGGDVRAQGGALTNGGEPAGGIGQMIRVDGIDYATEGPALGQAVARLESKARAAEGALAEATKALELEKKRADSAEQAAKDAKSELDATKATLGEQETKLTESEKRVSEAEGKAAAAEKRADGLQAEVDKASAPETLDRLASERAELVEAARRVLGKPDFRADGLSAEEIRRTVVAGVHGEDAIKDRDDVYVSAAFEYLARNHRADRADDRRTDATDKVTNSTGRAQESAMSASLKPSTPPWRQPL